MAAVAALVATFGVAYWADRRSERNTLTCEEKLALDESRVHTSANWSGRDIFGIGEYPETHWKVDALSNPCSSVPGPDDWRFQGVIKLRPENAATVLAGYRGWRPATPTVHPELRQFVPADVSWQSAEADSGGIVKYSGTVYLATEQALVYFDLTTR